MNSVTPPDPERAAPQPRLCVSPFSPRACPYNQGSCLERGRLPRRRGQGGRE